MYATLLWTSLPFLKNLKASGLLILCIALFSLQDATYDKCFYYMPSTFYIVKLPLALGNIFPLD